MVKVRVRPETGNLYFDFGYRGARCREQTALADTPTNRKTVEALAKRIQRDIERGSFEYARYFPDSPRVQELATEGELGAAMKAAIGKKAHAEVEPLFRDFADVWYQESLPRWRKRHQVAMRETIDRMLLPTFGDQRLGEISRADLLGFRAVLAQRKGHGGQLLSAKRINKLMAILRSILNEGCDRYGLVSPGRSIKPLKQKRSEVFPFDLGEVNALIANVRADYRAYLIVRLFSGMRTGEANGLQWSDVDFAHRTISIERAISRDGDGELKTDCSRRIIPMVPQIQEALEEHKKAALPDCPWVFHTRHGHPIDAVNFTNRVWYPLLRYLGLKKRPPYQMRHTAATLMLASGENPEWVAQVLGHSTTEMLFRVYSRFVPNLTRNDGRAFAGLLNHRFATTGESGSAGPAPNVPPST
jgi:integrase